MTAGLTTVTVLTTWQFVPLVSVPLALCAVLYLAGARTVARRHPARPWPRTRTAAFFTGLAAVAVAVQGSDGVYDDVLLRAHMVQHLLLIMAAPPLLVYGRPVTLLLHASRNPWHGKVIRGGPLNGGDGAHLAAVHRGALLGRRAGDAPDPAHRGHGLAARRRAPGLPRGRVPVLPAGRRL